MLTLSGVFTALVLPISAEEGPPNVIVATTRRRQADTHSKAVPTLKRSTTACAASFIGQRAVSSLSRTLHLDAERWKVVFICAGIMERTLTASEVRPVAAPRRLATPLAVSASAVALPHPEKVGAGHPKAVNRKAEGWGGEDAYFCIAAE